MARKKEKIEEFVKLYVPELQQLVESGDEKMCLMMAQLEYWFGLKPDGFYKFMNPPKEENPAYCEGDSWTEEMGMSSTKIENALKSICTRYKSFSDYKNAAGDKFKGKFYWNYYHKPSHKTYYFRNHEKTNEALKRYSLDKRALIFWEKHSLKIGKVETMYSGDAETNIPEYINAEVVYTENTSENNTYITQEREDFHFQTKANTKRQEERESYH